MKYFKGSLIFTLFCICLAAILGYNSTHTFHGTCSVVFICLLLAVLEISLSFDNAVVNALVLKNMGALWQQRFLTWGVLIAVIGMRLLFPLCIVGIASDLGPISVLSLAINQPEKYTQILNSAHTQIMGFGGSFLLMVGLKYFFDSEKTIHWCTPIECHLVRFSNLKSVEIAIILLLLFIASRFLPLSESSKFLSSGICGLLIFIIVDGLSSLLKIPEETSSGSIMVKNGLSSFIYLEILDASFSFDGVIGAFALSTNLFIIAIGLGIGAMFVRSLTVLLVQKDTLSEYRYLEHGAFWAILALAIIMFINVRVQIPEIVTGSIGALLIILALISSIRWNKRNAILNTISSNKSNKK